MRQLERTLGAPAVVAISLSAMLGSGLFVLPGLAAARTGSSVWLAYLLAGLCVLPAALSKCELAAAMPRAGGSYIYLNRTFGPVYGTVAGLALWLSLLLKSAFALLGFGTYLRALTPWPVLPTALVLLVCITALNIFGVRKVGRAQVVVVAVTVTGLLVVALLALGQSPVPQPSPPLAEGFVGLFAATAFVFVSYNGVTKVAAIAEEVRAPERNLPRGMLLSLAIALTLYTLVALALVWRVPVAALAGDLRPIHSLAAATAGPVAAQVAAWLGIITMTSMANAGLLAASRFPFAMSRDRLLPAFLQRTTAAQHAPMPAIVLTSAAMALAMVLSPIERLAKLASAIILMTYIAENIALVILRESRVRWYKPTYRSPAYPWVQLLGVLTGSVLLANLGWTALAAALWVLAPGLLLYLLVGRRRCR
ncbi:MAG: APC family permease, partial [Polyangiales bacterium]